MQSATFLSFISPHETSFSTAKLATNGGECKFSRHFLDQEVQISWSRRIRFLTKTRKHLDQGVLKTPLFRLARWAFGAVSTMFGARLRTFRTGRWRLGAVLTIKLAEMPIIRKILTIFATTRLRVSSGGLVFYNCTCLLCGINTLIILRL